jgi:protein-tyrosine phosphatase
MIVTRQFEITGCGLGLQLLDCCTQVMNGPRCAMACLPAEWPVGESVIVENDVCWIEGDPHAALAVVLRPRGGEWLADELLRMKQSGITTLVSLLESEEAAWLGLAQEGPLAGQVGLQFLSHPIPDVHVPQKTAAFRSFVADLVDRLRAGERIGVHCRGSIGRSTVTAACTLIHLGWSPHDALVAIEAARGCPVPDTEEQREWILSYKAQP